jgi:hypothetical protein
MNRVRNLFNWVSVNSRSFMTSNDAVDSTRLISANFPFTHSTVISRGLLVVKSLFFKKNGLNKGVRLDRGARFDKGSGKKEGTHFTVLSVGTP